MSALSFSDLSYDFLFKLLPWAHFLSFGTQLTGHRCEIIHHPIESVGGSICRLRHCPVLYLWRDPGGYWVSGEDHQSVDHIVSSVWQTDGLHPFWQPNPISRPPTTNSNSESKQVTATFRFFPSLCSSSSDQYYLNGVTMAPQFNYTRILWQITVKRYRLEARSISWASCIRPQGFITLQVDDTKTLFNLYRRHWQW